MLSVNGYFHFNESAPLHGASLRCNSDPLKLTIIQQPYERDIVFNSPADMMLVVNAVILQQKPFDGTLEFLTAEVERILRTDNGESDSSSKKITELICDAAKLTAGGFKLLKAVGQMAGAAAGIASVMAGCVTNACNFSVRPSRSFKR
eukprot:TRINITY_DN2800_c0_g1_i1.p2 TRINITY_DN2800_c0_g1~~TRINITY_DN2800_c0_g1_i1.p2  ORF type:complete len:148 (+),score=26.61 TRINITY_DN2800_c0_g1_i1:538-981(+)